MKAFLEFFEYMPSWQKLSIVLISLFICWILEKMYPLFDLQYSKIKHGSVNLCLFWGLSIINFLFSLFLVNGLSYFQNNKFGLLHLLDFPIWVEILLAVLILDLVAQYVIHFCLHKIQWMWKLHIIHHSDTFLDATSGTRHHPGDYVLREIFSFFTLVIMGIPVAYYFLFRICTIFFTYINHANIEVPHSLDRLLSCVFITPNLHKIHHHYKQPWTDRNFGNIFSFWDRIFGTLIQEDPKKVRYGLDFLGDEPQDSVLHLLKLPWISCES